MFTRLSPLLPYLRRYWRSFLWGGLALLIYNSAKVVIPLLIGNAVDDMRHGLVASRVEHDALLLFAVAALSGIFLYLMRQIIIGASREIEFDIRNDLFRHLESQPPSFFQRHRTGDIMARSTNDLSAVRQLLGPAIMYSANTLVFTAAALPFMIHISPRLTLIAFLPLPFASILVQYFGARIHTRFERIQAMFSDISAQAEENFSGARLIRAFAQEEAQIAAFETSNQEYIRRSLRLVRLMAMLWPTLEFVLGISLMITLFVGGREVVLHRMSVGQFTSYFVYMTQLTWPMIAIGWVTNLVQRGAASLTRIHSLMTEPPAIDDRDADPALMANVRHPDPEHREGEATPHFASGNHKAVLPSAVRSAQRSAAILSAASQPHRDAKSKDPDATHLTATAEPFSTLSPEPWALNPVSPIRGHIAFRNLRFSYPTGGEVLHNLSLDIPAGSSLAITGPTGSGKSTLVSLIPRLYDAEPGMVLLDGRPIRDYPLETLRRAIGFVPPETFLFSTTLRENIAFGVPGASDDAVLEAARTAHIAVEILEFSRGFQTIVGERGMTLSGGQKQRTAIARAVLRDPRILILDDALSSVDTYTEEQILTGLRETMQGRTSILIAHRISTARSADRIAVLLNGRIVELGTHDELLARGGYYSDLVEKQSLEEEIVNA